MKYDFLVDSYETERVKVLSVWSEFMDDDLPGLLTHRGARGTGLA